MVNETKDFLSAEKLCESLDAHLVILRDAVDIDFLASSWKNYNNSWVCI